MVTIFDKQDVSKNKGTAILMAILPFLFFVPYMSDNMKKSPYLKFRANQSFVMLLPYALYRVAVMIFDLLRLYSLPLIGTVLSICGSIIDIVFVLYLVIGIICVATEESEGRRYPIIGGIQLLN